MTERPNSAEPSSFRQVAERLRDTTLARSLADIGLAAYSFRHVPEERLYRTTRTMLSGDSHIPLQPPLETLIDEVETSLLQRESAPVPRMNMTQLSGFISAFMQFGDLSPAAQSLVTPAADILKLHDSIIKRAKADGPLSYSDEFAMAVSLNHDVSSALWTLFLTSRHFARWRDADILPGFPDVSRDEAISTMLEWETSIAALKHPDFRGFQDSAGDNYYVWTHALGRVVYTALPERPTLVGRAYATAMAYGSHAMSMTSLLGRVSALGTMSNHIPAARYGNLIGDSIARAIKQDNQ